MTRVAFYARYSTDLQSARSVDDQLRVCQERADREGWQVVGSYHDRAISGSSMNRPGLMSMMQDARNGKFDIFMAEALDRISRDQENIAHIYKQMNFSGVTIFTLSEGVVNELHIGLNGTMNQLFITELRKKTHRGLKGRAIEGKSAGGRAYGYQTVRKFDHRGEVIDEERVIIPEEAAVVVRIFEDYIKGKSPRKIATELNAENIPGPHKVGWGSSTINGNRVRGTGILNNALYIGQMIWNRQRYVKDPSSGKRISRLNPESEWVLTDLPELRIVPQELWDKVKAYQASLDRKPILTTKRRPPRLLSYLLQCGECGGGFSMISKTHYGCYNARNKGNCGCRTGIAQEKLEAQVLSVLHTRLLDSELTAIFCEEYTRHINKLRIDQNRQRADFENELARVEKAIAKIVESIKQGIDVSIIKDEANALQRRKEQLISLLETTDEAPSYIHPAMAGRYAKAVNELIASLNNPDHRDESAKLLRALIDKIVLTPNEDKSALVIDLHGDLAGILQMSSKHGQGKIVLKTKEELEKTEASELQQVKLVAGVLPPHTLLGHNQQGTMVAGVGFEPTTFRL